MAELSCDLMDIGQAAAGCVLSADFLKTLLTVRK